MEYIVKVTSSRLYRYAREVNLPMDLSEWDLEGDNIEDLDLSNLGLIIDLKHLYAPSKGFNRLSKDTSEFHFSPPYGDTFVDLRRTRLSGNCVYGSLKNRLVKNLNNQYEECIFLYNEDTFDKGYKKLYPEFFLDKEADESLKKKFYEPFISKGIDACFGMEQEVMFRQKLTFEEYLDNYRFLHEKYLGRFNINPYDYALIRLCEIIGLKNTKLVLNGLITSKIPLNIFLQNISNMTDQQLWNYFDYDEYDKTRINNLCKEIDSVIKK